MTASELYSIVKDCREAWPEGVEFCSYSPQFYHHPGSRDVRIPDAHAVLMFEASGMRWLTDHFCEGDGVMLTHHRSGEGGSMGHSVGSGAMTRRYGAPSRIHAIYAAIAAVKGKA